MLRTLVAKLLGSRPRLTPYPIDRAAGAPVDASALASAIMGAGFRITERRRRLVAARTHGRDQAIVPLPRSRVLGAGPIAIRASDRDLVLGLMTAMSSVLGALRLHTPELGEVVVTPPTQAASPNTQRSWVDVPRPRVASHYAIDERGRPPRRR
jgi:hypothetical protein